jgi:hypothetical protein
MDGGIPFKGKKRTGRGREPLPSRIAKDDVQKSLETRKL